ncbi:MAG: hypothetical protein DRJ37_01965 [Thermoprotei archaeon]|nr:MAG: hypothetical protein DRJ37_01965 [Thermoprotei archaeon]
MSVKPPRPLGVTILAILSGISGIFSILAAIGFGALMGLGMMAMLREAIREYGRVLPIAIPIGTIVLIIAAILFIMGLIDLAIAWGLWTGKGWAWWLVIIFTGLGILMQLGNLGLTLLGTVALLSYPRALPGTIFSIVIILVGLGINVLIIWYFFRPHVKAYFGMGPAVAQPPPPPPPPV